MRLREITALFVLVGFASGTAAAAPLTQPALGDPRTDRTTFGRSYSTTAISDPNLGDWSFVAYPPAFPSPFALRNPWSVLSSFYLVGTNDFMTGYVGLQSSRLTLRLPKVFGLEPLVAGGAAGRTSFTDLGLRYTLGHFEAGTRVTLSRFDPTGANGEVTSTSFVRYADERMSLGLSYWAALALIGGRPVSTMQSMGASVGLRPKPDGSILYANLLVPLMKGVSTTQVSAFGRF